VLSFECARTSAFWGLYILDVLEVLGAYFLHNLNFGNVYFLDFQLWWFSHVFNNIRNFNMFEILLLGFLRWGFYIFEFLLLWFLRLGFIRFGCSTLGSFYV